MKGFVETPAETVDLMVERLFNGRAPREGSRLLDPGCGHGALLKGVMRWCARNGHEHPEIVGIDLDPAKVRIARRELASSARIKIVQGDFLSRDLGTFDYILGNPPYVAIEELSEDERLQYRATFQTATGRIDLYLLFWEQALKAIRPSGRIVFITPEKYSYVESARPLRRLMGEFQIEELFYSPENTFVGLTTYPIITVVSNSPTKRRTMVRPREGESHSVQLPKSGESWQPAINRSPVLSGKQTLADVSLRISCGVATGADQMFLFSSQDLPKGLARFAKPTIGGRELQPGQPIAPSRSLLVPYDDEGNLLPLSELGSAANYLKQSQVSARLRARTCVRRKPWYAFHETPPLTDLLRPKLLCKDIAKSPHFWLDKRGTVVPLHSSYYIVPTDPQLLPELAAYLSSTDARGWLLANCQRAANGFIRMQSSVLKRLPIPDDLFERAVAQSLAA